MMLIERKGAFYIWAVVALLTYFGVLYLFEYKTGGRIHWAAAILLNIGGPHLLSGVLGLIAGFFAALCYQCEMDKKDR